MVIKMKKGIIFTMVSVMMSAIILTAFFYSTVVPPDISVVSTKIRISSINGYIDQLDSYISSQISATSRVALHNMTNIIIQRDSYFVDSFEEEFIKCMQTGEVQNNEDCGANLQMILDEMDQIALNSLNVVSTLTLKNVTIYQVSPWSINVKANVSIDIVDSYAEWHLNKTYEGNTSILLLPDPTYEVNTDWRFAGTTYANNFTTPDPWTGWIRYPSTLNILAISYEYFQYDKAPSFLSRLNGDLDNQDGSLGIASLVIPNGRPEDVDVSTLDYTYWRWKNCDLSPRALFDFYANIDNIERSKLNISKTSGFNINGTVVPMELVTSSNMDDSDYYQTPVGC